GCSPLLSSCVLLELQPSILDFELVCLIDVKPHPEHVVLRLREDHHDLREPHLPHLWDEAHRLELRDYPLDYPPLLRARELVHLSPLPQLDQLDLFRRHSREWVWDAAYALNSHPCHGVASPILGYKMSSENVRLLSISIQG